MLRPRPSTPEAEMRPRRGRLGTESTSVVVSLNNVENSVMRKVAVFQHDPITSRIGSDRRRPMYVCMRVFITRRSNSLSNHECAPVGQTEKMCL